jgi:hypothetical protein
MISNARRHSTAAIDRNKKMAVLKTALFDFKAAAITVEKYFSPVASIY